MHMSPMLKSTTQVYTSEGVWQAQVEEALKALKALEATKKAMEAEIDKVGLAGSTFHGVSVVCWY